MKNGRVQFWGSNEISSPKIFPLLRMPTTQKMGIFSWMAKTTLLRGQIIDRPFVVPSAQRPFAMNDGRYFGRSQLIDRPFWVPSAQRPFAMGAGSVLGAVPRLSILRFAAHRPFCSDGTGVSIHSRIEA